MIKHIVFWQIKDELEKQIVMPKMKQMLVSLVGKIDGLVSAEVGFNYNGGDYDIALYSVFESKEALALYADHPEHLVVKKYVHEVIKGRTAVDYEI